MVSNHAKKKKDLKNQSSSYNVSRDTTLISLELLGTFTMGDKARTHSVPYISSFNFFMHSNSRISQDFFRYRHCVCAHIYIHIIYIHIYMMSGRKQGDISIQKTDKIKVA